MGIFVHCLDDEGPIKLLLAPSRDATSMGATRDPTWCLEIHLARTFARGIHRKVDEYRGAPVVRRLSRHTVLERYVFLVFGGGGFL